MATRPLELERALDSIESQQLAGRARAVVVANGADLTMVMAARQHAEVIYLPENVGIPAGRHIGISAAATSVIGLLDDDAELTPEVSAKVLAAFAADDRLGADALRLNDEDGETTRRHVPRVGGTGVERGGEATFFVGAAHAIRAEAYRDAGGYFGDLWYGHEEIEFSWRLIDAGWKIAYLADAIAFHPRTEISRHPDGWRLTGRNRVWIARRTLPWPIAIIHVVLWLLLGVRRAPGGCRRAYVRGWLSGWRGPIEHRPIGWRTVWRLTRLGRPPVI
ncbi:MAG: glycosyltransferase [Actinomycetota bacterium]|nr:glycosyltransferase [Actinomycetota bacterium]